MKIIKFARNHPRTFMVRIFISFALFFLSNGILSAQKAWSLQECIDYAISNNINILQSDLNIELAENQVLQDKMNMYTPLISSDISHSFNFSASLDPLTFEFIRDNTQSTRMNLNGSLSIFEGMSRMNALRADAKELEATQLDKETLMNNTKLLVANSYLQILIANEVMQVAMERKALTSKQFGNTSELVNAGVRPRGDLLELEAQLANDELGLVNAQINLQKALNQLKLLLQLDPYEAFSVQQINITNEDQVVVNPQMVTSRAMEILPNLRSAELKRAAAENDLKSAKGLLSPTLNFSAFVGTNYFSAAREVVAEENLGQIPIGIVNSSGDVVNSITEFSNPVFGDLSFGQQFTKNFNENLVLSLSIPIFGKWQRMLAIDNSKINLLNTEYNIALEENQLKQDVFNAYTDMTAASSRFQAAEYSLNAAKEAFNYANEKYQAGLMNALEFETAKNRLVSTEAELIQAKYEYAFRKMIVNFYQTGTIEL